MADPDTRRLCVRSVSGSHESLVADAAGGASPAALPGDRQGASEAGLKARAAQRYDSGPLVESLVDKPTRTDPCPCGSGRKYKSCCWADHAAAAVPTQTLPGGDLDPQLAQRIARWVTQQAPVMVAGVERVLGTELLASGEGLGLLANLVAYDLDGEDGAPLAVRFRESQGHLLDPEERRYLDAQIEAWFSIWEVLSVEPGQGFRARDLLTGEERAVRERSATETLKVRDGLFARIVRRGVAETLGCCSPHVLSPRDTQEVVETVRRDLKLGRGRVDPAVLRGPPSILIMIAWDKQAELAARERMPLMQNTDGDDLLLVTDRFAFDPPRRAEVLRALSRLRGAETPEPGPAGSVVVVLTRPGNAQRKDWDNTVVAHVQVAADHLAVETNSLQRAQSAGESIGRGLRGLLAEPSRKTRSADELLAQAKRAGQEGPRPRATSPEQDRIALEFKRRHYGTWPDHPLPALEGLTPREAAGNRRRRAYRDLELLLKEFEHHEAGEPEASRFDVGILRRELGMEA